MSSNGICTCSVGYGSRGAAERNMSRHPPTRSAAVRRVDVATAEVVRRPVVLTGAEIRLARILLVTARRLLLRELLVRLAGGEPFAVPAVEIAHCDAGGDGEDLTEVGAAVRRLGRRSLHLEVEGRVVEVELHERLLRVSSS